MAWNRSDRLGKAPVTEKTQGKDVVSPRVTGKGAIAGLVVVLGLLIVVLCVWQRAFQDLPKDKTESKRRMIAEVKPALATNAVSSSRTPDRKLLPQIVGETRDGYRLLPDGSLHKVVGVTTSKMSRVSLARRTFDEPADQSIGELMSISPGTALIGDSKFMYRNFEKYLRQALKTPIVIANGDSDEVRALKEAVIDVRAELKERMDKGEDVGQVMRETRDQMRELGLYKREIEKQVEGILKNDSHQFSKRDVQDLVDAANKMLESRGSKPMMLTGAMAYRLRMNMHRQNKKEKK